MKFLILALLLISCGKKNSSSPADVPQGPFDDSTSSILSQFINTNASSALPTLDLRLLTLDGKQPSSNAITCDGTLGNSGKVRGVDENEVRVIGDEKNGTIEFGHLSYVGATEYDACRAASKEAYTYSVSNKVLTLCNVNCINGVYPSCQANPCETFQEL